MEFIRNNFYDNLILEVKNNKDILKKLDYEELALFINYLIDLNKYLKGEKGE